MKNLRKAERFTDFGRVENSGICMVSGILQDISKTGLKVSYSVPPSIDMEKEYEVTVRLSRGSSESLSLMVKPAWVLDTENEGTCAGFSILHSKDSAKLEEYLSVLKEDSESETAQLSEKTDDSSLFI